MYTRLCRAIAAIGCRKVAIWYALIAYTRLLAFPMRIHLAVGSWAYLRSQIRTNIGTSDREHASH